MSLNDAPSSLSARRGQVLPAVHREVLPVMSTLLRSGTPCPRLTSLDKLTQGSLPQDPSLTEIRDGTDAGTHRIAVSRPRSPSKQRHRRRGSPTSRPPPSPASHGTGMPRQPSHDAQRRVPLHMTCLIDARRARSLPSRPRLTRPSTLTTLMPPPCLRRAAASKFVNSILTQPDRRPPPSGPAHGRPAAYACYEGSSAVPGHAQ